MACKFGGNAEKSYFRPLNVKKCTILINQFINLIYYFMKKRFTSLMTLVVMLLCTSSAWAQSVVSVGINLDFAEGTPVDNGICTYAKDMETNATTYSQMLEVAGWTIEGENGDARAGGLFAYGSGHWLGGTGYNVPATNPAGAAEGNALGIVAVWDAVAQYTQPVTLEAGSYELHIAVYNAVGGTTAPAKSLIGFIADNGTEYLAPAKAYAVDAWTEEVVAFTLTEATTGKLSLGYDAPNSGSGANQHLFFDKVEILSVETPITVESPWVGAAVENGKTYYLYNTKAKAFLNGANSWGTQASLGQDGLPFIAEGADGVFAFNGVVSNGGANHYLGNAGYIDSGSAQFTLTEVIDGVYTIGWGTNYYASAEGSTILATVTELSDACYWQFLTAEDIHAAMANATAPLNVTSLLACPNFGRNNLDFSKWQGSPARGGANENMCAEKFATNFDVYQTISVPNGLYKVTAQGFYRMGTKEVAADTIEAGCTSTNAMFYANEKSVAFPNIYVDSASVTAGVAVPGHGMVPNTMSDASAAFTAGLYQMDTIEVAVLNGQLTIGFKKDVTVADDWSIFDNVQIIYCGSDFTAEAVGSVNPADYPANQLFAIMNVTGKNFLTANSGITIDARDEENANQCFYFVATETANQYHLKTYGGKYVKSAHGNNWTMTAATETSANTLHEIVAVETGVYTIGMVNAPKAGTIIGTDNLTNGSATYSDKAIANNGKWYIIPVTYDITSALQAIIDDAKTITGDMSKAASEELAAAITAAEAAIAIELPDTVTGATTRLNAAVEAATASVADYAALSANIAVYDAMYVDGANGSAAFGEAIATAKAALAEGTAGAETLTTLAAAYTVYLTSNEVAGLVNGTFDAPNQKNGWADGVGSMGTGNHNKWTNVNDGFVEKWTPAPGALADLDFYQVVKDLPAGTYTFAAYVNACLQSQPDTYEVKGVKLYANGDSVEVHTINVDRDEVNKAKGPELIMIQTTLGEGDSLKVGLSVKSTDANWVVMDNAKLYSFDPNVVLAAKLTEAKALLEQNPHVAGVFGEELKAQIAAANNLPALIAAVDSFVVAIPSYTTLNAIVTEYENVESLAEAVAAAKGVLTSTTATVAEVDAAYVVFEQAVYEYRFAVATVDYACDMTSRYIVNPQMVDGTTGWTSDMATQGATYTNGDVTIVQFIEKWTGSGALGTAYATQVVRELPKGLYRMTADVIACRQDGSVEVTGAYLFMNSDSVSVATGNGAPERVEVYCNLTSADTIVLGFTAVNTTANWVCFDNVKLEYCGKQSNIGYFTLDKALAEGASDPIYAMLAADPKLNVTLNVITDKSETAVVDLSGYDAIIVQESFGSSDGILTKGALSPSNVKVPYLINKIFGFQKNRITDGATTETEGTLNLTVVNPESPLFNGIEGTDVKMFHAGADDSAGNTRNKTFGYSTGVTLSAEGTLVAAPTGAADVAQVAINVIPAGATVGTHTLEAQMITMNMNYGALTREAGRYLTDANYTLWRNAVYTLVGLDVPAEGVDMPVNDDCDVTGVVLDTAAVTLKEDETYTFTATVAPATAVDQSVVWSSSDEAVATVANGVVTAVSFGRATITVTTVDGGFKATATVTVTPAKAAKWDFRAWDATVLDAMKADKDHWASTTTYIAYKVAAENSALMVGEAELEATKGLLFTGKARQIRIFSSEEDLMANYILGGGEVEIVIPALATDTITVGAAEYTIEGATLVDGVYVADQDNVTLTLPKNVELYYIDLVAGPGVGIANVEGEVVSRAYYNLSGVVVDVPVQGINIVKTTYKDGSVKVQKVYVK